MKPFEFPDGNYPEVHQKLLLGIIKLILSFSFKLHAVFQDTEHWVTLMAGICTLAKPKRLTQPTTAGASLRSS
jgi:hypothetical protein